MPFDIQGARNEGYSDDEIIQHLAKQQKFDAKGALSEGYDQKEVLKHLISNADAPPKKETEDKGFLAGAGNAASGLAHGVNDLAKTALSGNVAKLSRDLIQPNLDALNRAGESFGEGHYDSALRHAVAGAVPLIGPMGEKAGDLYEKGRYKEGTGDLAVQLAAVAAPEVPKALKAGARGVGSVGVSAAKGIARNVLKPSAKLAGRGVVESMLEEGTRVTEHGVNKAKGVTRSMESAVDKIIDSSGDARKANLGGRVAKGARELRSELQKQPSPTPAVKALDKAVADFYQAEREGGAIAKPGKAARNVTAREAHDIKKAGYQELGDSGYGPLSAKQSAKRKSTKMIARAAKEVVGELHPEAKPFLKREANSVNLTKALESAVNRHANKGWGKEAIAGTIGGIVLHGIPGGAITALAVKILREPAVRSQVAISLYKASKGLMKIGEAKSAAFSLAERYAALKEEGGPPIGLSVQQVTRDGKVHQLARSRVETYKMGAAVLNKYGKDMTLPEFTKVMEDVAGPEWNVETVGSKTKPMTPEKILAGARAMRPGLERLSGLGKDNLGVTPHDVIEKRTNRGVELGGKVWYDEDVAKMVERYGEEKTREMMTNESIFSPNQKLGESITNTLDYEKFGNYGGEEPSLGRYPANAGRMLANREATGPKVSSYDYYKKESLPGGPGKDVPPRFLPIDKIETQGSGFSDIPGKIKDGKQMYSSPTETIRAYTDFQLRMEAKRLGFEEKQGQSSNWVGTQEDLQGVEGGKSTPWARAVMEEIDRREATGERIMDDGATDFDTAAMDATTPQMASSVLSQRGSIDHITNHVAARAVRDLETPGVEGFTINRSGKPYESGYSVVPFKEGSERSFVSEKPFTSAELRRIAQENADVLGQDGWDLGGWKDGERRMIEISKYEPDLNKALALGKEFEQKAIFDHATKKSIPLQGIGSVVILNDGRVLTSDFVQHSQSRLLPTHLSIIEKAGVSPDQVAHTGWINDGVLDLGGGGSVGKGGFTLGEYEAGKKARE